MDLPFQESRAGKFSPPGRAGFSHSLQERGCAASVPVIAEQPRHGAPAVLSIPSLSCRGFCFHSGSLGSPVILCSACVTLYKLELLRVEIDTDKCCNHMGLSEQRDLKPLFFLPFISFFFPPLSVTSCTVFAFPFTALFLLWKHLLRGKGRGTRIICKSHTALRTDTMRAKIFYKKRCPEVGKFLHPEGHP